MSSVVFANVHNQQKKKRRRKTLDEKFEEEKRRGCAGRVFLLKHKVAAFVVLCSSVSCSCCAGLMNFVVL